MRSRFPWKVALFALASLLAGSFTIIAEDEPPADAPAADAEAEKPEDDNPYIPRDDLSSLELFELIERYKNLPKSLQGRPGFGEAIVVCAERILAAKPDDTLRSYALRAKMDGRQRTAIWDEDASKREAAQKQLTELATSFLNDPDKDVVHWAKFYLLEDKVLAAEKLEPAKLPPVLDEVRQFIKQEKLDNRHVRMASATVKLINKLESDEEANKAYKEFGSIFAASTDDELHRYGDRIAEGIPQRPSDRIGKLIPIAGPLVDGGNFDSANWKGNVVLVDFWATWCGPCVAALPELQTLHEKYRARGFEIIGVNLDEDREALTTFLKDTPLPWPNIVDKEAPADAQMAKKYGVVAIPTTYLLDKQGKLVAVDLPADELSKEIEKLLKL